MKADQKLAGADILCAEPLVGYSTSDIQQWLLENNHTDAAIAEAMAAVKSKTGWLRHELDDSDNDNATKARYHEEFNDWRELEQELVFEIIRRLEQQNFQKESFLVEIKDIIGKVIVSLEIRDNMKKELCMDTLMQNKHRCENLEGVKLTDDSSKI